MRRRCEEEWCPRDQIEDEEQSPMVRSTNAPEMVPIAPPGAAVSEVRPRRRPRIELSV